MKIWNLVFLSMLSCLAFTQAIPLDNTLLKNEDLVGEWIIDLRPYPDAAPYLQSFIISKQDEKSFIGQFYGSPAQEAFVNKNWNRLYFAFKTADNSNTYYQSGYIEGDEIFGITFCPGRDFVMPWRGEKKKE